MTKNTESSRERFKKERTLLCALRLPKDMHDRALDYLARRAGLDPATDNLSKGNSWMFSHGQNSHN